jgi:hypothetical protein
VVALVGGAHHGHRTRGCVHVLTAVIAIYAVLLSVYGVLLPVGRPSPHRGRWGWPVAARMVADRDLDTRPDWLALSLDAPQRSVKIMMITALILDGG